MHKKSLQKNDLDGFGSFSEIQELFS